MLVKDRDIEIVPHPRDPDPSALLGNLPAAVSHKARVTRPMIRRGWLERGPGPDDRRGSDEFVPVSWAEALDHAGAELRRIYATHGPRAVFGGSYGWASAAALTRRASSTVFWLRRRLCPLGNATARAPRR